MIPEKSVNGFAESTESPAAFFECVYRKKDSQVPPQHTSVIATAASFRTSRGSQPSVARDPAISIIRCQGTGDSGQKKIPDPYSLFPVCWRREGDSNPRYTFVGIHTISSRAPSAARASLLFYGPLYPVPCLLAERGGFEPPWELLTPKSISSRSRYDHFGISPQNITLWQRNGGSYPLLAKKSTHNFSARLFPNTAANGYVMIQSFVIQDIVK
jgi:hypothetical protein